MTNGSYYVQAGDDENGADDSFALFDWGLADRGDFVKAGVGENNIEITPLLIDGVEHAFSRSNRIAVRSRSHDRQERGFRIGRPDTRRVEFVWNQRLHLTA